MVLDKQVIIKVLQFSIQVGVDCASLSPNFPKIPFLLIEDLLEGQTLKHAASIWEIIESMVDTLTLPELFNRGKFVILRTCNSLLRRLSKSCHTEVCLFSLLSADRSSLSWSPLSVLWPGLDVPRSHLSALGALCRQSDGKGPLLSPRRSSLTCGA
jgi:hypothetical protein